MPKLWTSTIEAHRQEVREAILAATAALIADRGPRSVTMSRVAAKAGIGRATLYKYFPDVEAVLVAWHEGHVAAHLRQLAELGHASGDPAERVAAVLGAYAMIRYEHPNDELATVLHRGKHVERAHDHLHAFLGELLSQGARSGHFRDDIAPDELASYCLHAVMAARTLGSRPAVRRLVAVVLAGLRPTDGADARPRTAASRRDRRPRHQPRAPQREGERS